MIPPSVASCPWRRFLKHRLRNPAHQGWPWRPSLFIRHLSFLQLLLESGRFLRGEPQAAAVIPHLLMMAEERRGGSAMGTARRAARFPEYVHSRNDGCLVESGIPERALAKEN
jgi:hypothetical protein